MTHKKIRNLIIFIICFIIILVSFFLVNELVIGHVQVILNGPSVMQVEFDSEFTDPGVVTLLNGEESSAPTVFTIGEVNTHKLGDYTITYTASLFLETDLTERIISVIDTIPPVIELTSDPESFTLLGETYQEEGFTAIDNHDGDVTDQVIREEKEDCIFYTVTDSSGNTTTVKREIIYNDPIAPNVELIGDEVVSIPAGSGYEEQGYFAFDNCDGDITEKVEVEGEVNIYSAGTYTLTYRATDSFGNSRTATRTVIVEPIIQPDQVEPDGKTIYLTFDDGPGKYTEDLLCVLDKYNVKVTFFTIASEYSDIIKKEYEAGHSIGIHSSTHDYQTIYSSEKAFFDDIEQQQDLIEELTGFKTTLLRFPGGSSNTVSRNYCEGIMTQLVSDVTDMGFQYFDWNVSSGDAGETTDTEEVYQNVVSGCSNQDVSIVLLHDIKEYSVAAVEKIIIWGLTNGYTFLPLDASSPTVHHGVNN